MKNFKKDFSEFKEKIWLNAASEGPLPCLAVNALQESITWKSLPYQLDQNKFIKVPLELKENIARLLNTDKQDIILGNSASYGLHILSDGLSWESGDEILVMQNDFPTNILPWLALTKRGVKVLQIKPEDKVLTVEELQSNITVRTKLFCISHVHTFSGVTLDINAMSKVCRERDVKLILNISQSAGTMSIDVKQLDVDAMVCAGYKWLCGPYGTGFMWMKPGLRQKLQLNCAYWISYCSQSELENECPLNFRESTLSRKYDVFGTANFFNFVPFNAALKYWLAIGINDVQSYNMALVSKIIAMLDRGKYSYISPVDGPGRSNLLVISHCDSSRNRQLHEELIRNGIYTALWKGNIRISPHVYNDESDIKRLVDVLNRKGS